MKRFPLMLISVLAVILSGCRANRNVKACDSWQHAEETGVALQRVDSLSSTISEIRHVKIEYYPSCRAASSDSMMNVPAAIGAGNAIQAVNYAAGFGTVKSVEISTETMSTTGHVALTDSTATARTACADTRQTEKASEARQDNGTVAIASVVAAVALLIYLLIKSLLK